VRAFSYRKYMHKFRLFRKIIIARVIFENENPKHM